MKARTHASTPLATDEDVADLALNQAASGLHGAVDRAAAAADDAARSVSPAIERATEIAHQTVDKAASAAAPAAAWLDKKTGSLRASQQTAAADATDYVAAHPWKSLAFAAAAGFLISRILR